MQVLGCALWGMDDLLEDELVQVRILGQHLTAGLTVLNLSRAGFLIEQRRQPLEQFLDHLHGKRGEEG